MDKNSLTEFLFVVMNESNRMFSDVTLDFETDAIFARTVDGQKFMVTVSPVTADEALIELWARKNPELMSLALSVLNMRRLGEFTEEETDRYLMAILNKADNSCVKELKAGLKNDE